METTGFQRGPDQQGLRQNRTGRRLPLAPTGTGRREQLAAGRHLSCEHPTKLPCVSAGGAHNGPREQMSNHFLAASGVPHHCTAPHRTTTTQEKPASPPRRPTTPSSHLGRGCKKLGEMRSKGIVFPLISHRPSPARSVPPRRATGWHHNILQGTEQKGSFFRVRDHHTIPKPSTSHRATRRKPVLHPVTFVHFADWFVLLPLILGSRASAR